MELEIFKGAPKSTLAFKIYQKRNKTKTCFLQEPNAEFGKLWTSGIFPHSFTLASDAAVDLTAKVIQTAAKQSTYTNLDPIIGSIRTVVFRKNCRKDVKKFFSRTILHTGNLSKGIGRVHL